MLLRVFSCHATFMHIPVDFAGLHLRDVEYVVDEIGQPIAFGDDDLQVLADLFDGPCLLLVGGIEAREDDTGESLLDELGEAEYGGQGGA